jgi:hypothetical protein
MVLSFKVAMKKTESLKARIRRVDDILWELPIFVDKYVNRAVGCHLPEIPSHNGIKTFVKKIYNNIIPFGES